MNSHILFLTQILPYPPDSGPKVKTFHVLKYLSRKGYKITLISLIRQEDIKYVDKVREICNEVYPILIRRSRILDFYYLIRSQLSGLPFLIERDNFKEMHQIIQKIIIKDDVDIIHADQLNMTQYALPYLHMGKRKPCLIFDAHNAVWTIVDRMMNNSSIYLRPLLRLEAKRIKKYEGMIVRKFDHTLAVSDNDKDALIGAVLETNTNPSDKIPPVSIIPIAVDTDVLQPAKRQIDSLNILTIGTLYYPPNADGIRWFVREVFPLIIKEIPNVKLTIIGKNPPQDLVNYSIESENTISVTGYVDDLDPYFEGSALVVVPVRAGGGIRVRILEAFSRGMPVVTTTVGLEGIQAETGRDVLVADLPQDFANSVVYLLKNPNMQSQLAENGRHLAENKYNWQIVLRELDEVYRKFLKL